MAAQGSSMITPTSVLIVSNHDISLQRRINSLEDSTPESVCVGLKFDKKLFKNLASVSPEDYDGMEMLEIVDFMEMESGNRTISSEDKFAYYQKVLLKSLRTTVRGTKENPCRIPPRSSTERRTRLRDAMGEFAQSHRQFWYQHWQQQTDVEYTTHLSKRPSKLPSRDVLVCRRMKLAGDVYFPAG
ncbi:hypothetical protein PGT21_036437 [Puccinia graminis f. sp. tritici]|uniref:Uncharacterized protein n=1 Tax=Puccinia graminis f. sp. tritici TaxID=56615 RepID=A0A5B0QQB2_PUCGR|nr:hypothetical protein PGT21_036437 [Puccinia graminis f. sp. tritici]